MNANLLNPSKDDLLHFKSLENLSTSHLQVRLLVLQELNSGILRVSLGWMLHGPAFPSSLCLSCPCSLCR